MLGDGVIDTTFNRFHCRRPRPCDISLAATISTRSILSIEVIKEQFRVLSKAYSITPSAFERVQGMRRKVYDSHDYEEAITAFLEKRPAHFKGE